MKIEPFANLLGANLRGAELPCSFRIKDIHSRLFEVASQPGALDMARWHTCETTHCRAGWVVHLAGDAGRIMEQLLSTPTAAALIYAASDPELAKIPDFYATNDEAMADIKRLAGV